MVKKTNSNGSDENATVKRKKRKGLSTSKRTRYLALEPRIVFDGALGADIIDKVVDATHAAADPRTRQDIPSPAPAANIFAPADAEKSTSAAQKTTQNTEATKPASQPTESGADAERGDGLAPAEGVESRTEIVFVDISVRDFQALLDGISPTVRVVLLDPSKDAIAKIAEVTSQYQPGQIDALHIISHGSEGQIDIGSLPLNATTMQSTYAETLTRIGEHLSKDADILVYGCDFGVGDNGKAAADLLASLTGADVAASTDATGHADLGGDWDLELQDGKIESKIIVDRDAQERWRDVMALHTLDFDSYQFNPWTSGTSKNYVVDGANVNISYLQAVNANTGALLTPALGGTGLPVLGTTYSGGLTPTQNSLLFTIGGAYDGTTLGSNTITVDFSQQPGGGVANIGFALYDVDNTEKVVISGTKIDGTVIAPTQVATSSTNYIAAGTPGSGTSLSISGTGTDSGATQANGNTYAYFNTTNMKSVTFTYTGYAGLTIVNLADVTFLGLNTLPPTVDLDSSTSTPVTATDTFVNRNYANTSGGAIPWTDSAGAASSWVESDTAGGAQDPLAGNITVDNVYSPGDNQLRLTNSTTPGTYNSVSRAINLAGYSNATLQYNYDNAFVTAATASDIVTVEVSSNGGANYTVLKTYTGDLPAGSDTLSLAGYESANTMVRFRLSGATAYANASDFFYVDDITVSATATGFTNSYTEGDNTGVLISAGVNVSVTDSDSTNMSSAKVSIANVFVGDVLTFTPTGNITGSYDSNTGILTLSGTDTKANYATVIGSIRYKSTSDNPTNFGSLPTRNIGVVVLDSSGNEGNTAACIVNITGVNDAPVNTIPTAQSVLQNTSLVFSAAQLRPIAVFDADSSNVTVTLAVTGGGTLTLAGLTGLTFSAGDGTADTTMTFSGTQSAINNALNGLSFAAPNLAQTAVLTVTTSDGTLSDVDTVNIAVVANAPPTLDLDTADATTLIANDTFASSSYSNASTGGLPWSSDWQETDSTDGLQAVGAGQVRIVASPVGGAGNAIRMTDNAVTNTVAVKRSVDLSAYTSNAYTSTLSFDYSTNNALTGTDQFTVEIFNGSTWTTLDTVTTANNVLAVPKTYNISAFASADTEVRFKLTSGSYQRATAEYLYLDNVRVSVATAPLTGYVNTYTVGGSAANIASSASVSVTDDGANINSSSLVVSNVVSGDRLTINGSTVDLSTTATNVTSGVYTYSVTVSGTTTTVVFAGVQTKASYVTLLQGSTFSSTAPDPTLGGTVNSRSIAVTVLDSANQASNTAVSRIDLVTPNTAPTLDSVPVLSHTTYEDGGAPSGAVGTLISGLTGGITDPNSGALKGVAIVGANVTNGTWWYTTNGGSTWTSVGTVDATQSLLLADNANTRVYYQSTVANYSGTRSGVLTIRAWDRTSGAEGTKVSTASTGGTTAFSSASDTIDAVVVAVNDAPSGANKTINVLPGAYYTYTTADFPITDASDTPANIANGLLVTTIPANGQLYLDNVLVTTPGTVVSAADLSSGKLQYLADATTAVTRTWTFQVLDDGGTANSGVNTDTTPDTITMNQTGTNTAPTLDASKTPVLTAIAEDSVRGVGSGTLISSLVDFATPSGQVDNVTDPDSGAALGIAITAATTSASGGTWYFSTNGGTTWTALGSPTGAASRLLAADANTRLFYEPAANTNKNTAGWTVPTLTFRAWDRYTGTNGGTANTTTSGGTTAFSTATDTATVVIYEVNDAPTRTAGTISPITVNEDSNNVTAVTLGLTGSTFGVGGGTDESAQTLTYTITNIPSYITLWKADGTTSVTTGTVGLTQADMAGLKYKTVANGSGTGNITWTVTDNGTTNSAADPKTLTESQAITVTSINDAAPVLNNAPVLTMSVAEDAGVPVNGTAVGSLLSSFTGGITDTDIGAVKGIAITATVTTNGTWYYTTDGGTTWTNINAGSAVSATNALLLADNANTRLYFAPTANYAGATTSAALTFRAWDQTTGTAGTKVNPGAGGGTTAYSTASESIDLTVTTVNDAPVRTAGSIPSPITVAEDSSNITAVSLGLTASTFGVGGGADESSQTLTYTITNIPSYVTLWKTDGVTQVTTGTVGLTQADIAGLKYKTVADGNGTGNITWTITDNGTSGGPTSPVADPKTLTESVSITVTTVNDAPTRTSGPMTPVVAAEDSANVTAASLGLGAVTYGPGGGTDESTQALTYTITNIPSFVTLYKPNGLQVVAGNTLTFAEFQGLTYKTIANINGTGSITWTVTDNGTTNLVQDQKTLNESLAITVYEVNDAPVRTGSLPTFTSVAEDSANSTAVTLGLTGFSYGVGGGADESGQTLTYTITGIPSFITLFKADGTTSVTNGNTVTFAELQGLKYKTVANGNGTANITWSVTDNGTTNSAADPQSLNESFAVTVTGVNDAPTLGNGSLAAVNEDTASPAGATVSTIFTGQFADIDAGS
ncbi:MAG: DUF4347 domain-containing protein, partial [Burkholderiales bacterium]